MAKAKRIETGRQCLAQLRKLGYRKCSLQMTRMGTTYTMGGGYGGRLNITIGKGSSEFIVMDRVKDPFNYSMISAALGIGNLKDGAERALQELIERMVGLGVVADDVPVNKYEIVVGIAKAVEAEQQAVAS